MGRDKALLEWRGRPLVEHVAAAVRQAAGSVALVGGAEKYAGLGFPIIPDPLSVGPLGGIHAALAASTAEWNLVLACDMPAVSGALLSELLERAERSAADCLVPAGPSGRPEPLCAAYRLGCREALGAALQRDTRRVMQALAGLAVERWQVAESACFLNLNTPEEWARYPHA
jgi:molybdopterin-guanine dinucleotide biosynthesis protein A